MYVAPGCDLPVNIPDTMSRKIEKGYLDAGADLFAEAETELLGHVEFVTSTLFDVGVYLVVVGLVLDVLRSLGAEVDRQATAQRSEAVSVR